MPFFESLEILLLNGYTKNQRLEHALKEAPFGTLTVIETDGFSNGKLPIKVSAGVPKIQGGLR